METCGKTQVILIDANDQELLYIIDVSHGLDQANLRNVGLTSTYTHNPFNFALMSSKADILININLGKKMKIQNPFGI